MLTITLNLNYSTNVRSKQLPFFTIAQKNTFGTKLWSMEGNYLTTIKQALLFALHFICIFTIYFLLISYLFKRQCVVI